VCDIVGIAGKSPPVRAGQVKERVMSAAPSLKK
jgi:hypothetical protein